MNRLFLTCVFWLVGFTATVANAQPPASTIKPIPRKPTTKKPAEEPQPSILSEEDLFNLFKKFTRELERKTQEKSQAQKPKNKGVTDPQLISLHRDFLIKLEKAAIEFEENEQLQKAVEAYQAILRILPEHPGANKGMQRIFNQVATADKEVVKVHADKAWQSTGVVLQKGTPARIVAKGTWGFTLEMELTPEGITIPKELKDYKMGSLIGIILAPGDKKIEADDSFHVGNAKEFIVKKSGILYLRMYDIDPRDNEGELDVMIQSTFINR